MRKIILVGLCVLSLTSCSFLPKNSSESQVATETTNSAKPYGLKVDRIAREIGYDNYMRGNFDLEFTYEIKQEANVDDRVKYYTIVYHYKKMGYSRTKTYYIKVTDSDWEVLRSS